LAKLGDLSGFDVPAGMLLLAIYMRSEMSAGGILLTPNTRREDKYQGKVCLIVKIGPDPATVGGAAPHGSDPSTATAAAPQSTRFSRIPVALYDWIVVRPGDCWSLDVNADPQAHDLNDFWPCRLIFDDQIRAKVANPGMIW